jgi:hypothetical protein
MNKTRRRRVTTSDNTAGASVFELYEIHGDAKAALAACPMKGQHSKKTAEDFNRMLLSYMASDGNYTSISKTEMVKEMEQWEKKFGVSLLGVGDTQFVVGSLTFL